ncbi:MAG: CoA pyrophosphatase [Syntrophobacteraceae bacterium]
MDDVDTDPAAKLRMLGDTRALREHVVDVLSSRCGLETLFQNDDCTLGVRTSSVLLLLGEQAPRNGGPPEICVILNKRSKEVKQPGDLCCPGGAVESRFDSWYARLLALPGTPLSRWPCWSGLRRDEPERADFLSLLLAAGVRESWEEMRLNPFRLKFLGPMPSQCLILFRRVIHPMVVWVSRQKKYRLSWEVERIVRIPVRALLNPYNYATYRLFVPPHMEWRFRGKTVDFPCFVYCHDGRAELLWGVTFRIVTLFLEMAFGFALPDPATLPLVPASLDEDYVNGRHNGNHGRGRPETAAPSH